jgi:peroxiredoxin (alkyl hydroperoxide reductase subunit C)
MGKVSIALLVACLFLTATGQTQKESPPPAPKVKVGDIAPDFTLVDQNGQPHSLCDYKGKKECGLGFFCLVFLSQLNQGNAELPGEHSQAGSRRHPSLGCKHGQPLCQQSFADQNSVTFPLL